MVKIKEFELHGIFVNKNIWYGTEGGLLEAQPFRQKHSYHSWFFSNLAHFLQQSDVDLEFTHVVGPRL
jgi:hypothetical protein